MFCIDPRKALAIKSIPRSVFWNPSNKNKIRLFSISVKFWFRFFSSPEHIVLRVSYCDRSLSGVRPSVCPSVRLSVRPSVNNYLKILLLWNCPTDFSETSQKWSLGDALSKHFKDLNSMENSGCHGNREKKTLKIFLSQTVRARALIFCM